MKNRFLCLTILATLSGFHSLFAYNNNFSVKSDDIYNGYIIEKIWLNSFEIPKITISNISYSLNVPLPQDAQKGDPANFQVSIGLDRKRPFAIVRIPAFVADASGSVKQVSAFSLSFDEQPTVNLNPAAKNTDVGQSVLATGTWFKVGVPSSGFFKIDNTVITALGLNPANVNPANVRVFGNGGSMLSEDNSVPRASDLIENAVILNGNGDNVFDNGESVIFYAKGPMGWNKDSVNQKFTHVKNLYSDTAYYFITTDKGASLKASQQPALSSGNVNVNTFNYYDAHEVDLYNPASLGKNWYGEIFNATAGNSQTFTFDIGAPIASVNYAVSFASNSAVGGCTYDVELNGANSSHGVFNNGSTGDNMINLGEVSGSGANGAQVATFKITFTPVDGSGVGYLNYIEINGRRNLTISSDQLTFRDWQSVAPGNVAVYQLSGANSNTRVYDITDPQNPVLMSGTLSGTTYTFIQDARKLHEFAALNSTNIPTPKFVGNVANQNLHGTQLVDLIVVAHPDFVSQANQVADYHINKDGMKTVVATTTQIYNEFSSGSQDISAIRDFARMFYKRAGTDTTKMPKYLLLFGGASYDYKNRVPNNSNFVPVFESAESISGIWSISSDDFYGFLDDSENIETHSATKLNVLDISVGRLPARSVDDATNLANKILNYASPASLGPWRIHTTIVADKGCAGNNKYDDAGNHLEDGEAAATTIRNAGYNLYNVEKVYLDAMPFVSTPAGARCPTANAALNEQVFKGTFLINYNGHGNPQVWSGARILTQDDFNKWNNTNALPFMITATCDFGQFDHPQFVSAAEQLVLRKGGGTIAILTTTQAVYAFYNRKINTQYLSDQFVNSVSQSRRTLGDAYKTGKNKTFFVSSDYGEIVNFRKFSLLGDPALYPDFPRYKVMIDDVTDGYTQMPADTIKALGAYNITGKVVDDNGNTLSGFNGLASISFYDKTRTVSTITGCTDTYQVQNNVIYKGRVSVTNGLFSFSFITPKDINYYFGLGKISTYAQSDDGVTDAAGADTSVKVGGFSDHPVVSNEPPVVKAYINDSLFLNGGITGNNTSLYATLYAKTGINVSGNEVGHDLTAVLDDNQETPYILNEYYETAPNTYQRGYVSFPINGLADGKHTIKVKAWDVNNNSGEGSVEFVVIDGKVVDIRQLANYPNPFTNTTNFIFEHNHPDEELTVKLFIYNTAGGLVKNMEQVFTPVGSRSSEISWDGTDNNGSRLPSGVYVYRLNISTKDGFNSSAYQKLVIVR